MRKQILFTALFIALFQYGYSQCETAVQNIIENFNSQPDPNNRVILQDCWGIYYTFVDRGREVGSIQANGSAILMNSTYGAELYSPLVENTQGTLSFKATSNAGKILEVGTYSGSTFTKLASATMSNSNNFFTFDLSAVGSAGSNRLYFRFASGTGSSINLTLDDVTYKSFCLPVAAPTAIAKDIVAKLDATGNVIVNASSVDNGSTDDCGEFITNFSLDKSLFTCDDLGVNAVVLTATDSEGQTATATANITIEPDFQFNSNQLALDENGESIVDLDFLTKLKTDCGSVTYSLDQASYTCADAGYVTVGVTATYNGMTKNFSVSKNLKDYIDPVAIAQDISVNIDESTGLATITTDMIDDGSSDNCGIASLSLSRTTFSCGDQGENEVTLTATDAAGRTASATAIVTVGSFIEEVAVSTTSSTVCFDGSNSNSGATISTDASTVGVQYWLRKSADSSIVAGPLDGTGSGLSFSTGAVSENTTYHVYAEVPFSGKALDLSNSAAHLSVNTPGSFDYAAGYTISAWIKLDPSWNSTYYNSIFYAGGATGSDIEIYENPDGKLTIIHNRGNGGTLGSYLIQGNPITNSTYIHFAVTYDGSTSRVFVNGVEKGASAIAAPVKSSASEMTFGHFNSSSFPAAQTYDGLMDDIRVYDRALTANDILADYDKCISGSEDDLILYFDLESSSGSIYTDLVNSTPAQLKNNGVSTDEGAISCSFTCNKLMSMEVTIGDDVAPTAIAKNIDYELPLSGRGIITPEMINNESSDNCTSSSALTFSLDKSTFSCDETGESTVTLTVTDEAGNSSTATATVNIYLWSYRSRFKRSARCTLPK